MNLKNENNKSDKKEIDKKLNVNKFINKNINKKDKEKEFTNKKHIILNTNNNNLIKFINVSNTPGQSTEKIINFNNNINFINNIKTPATKNRIELKLELESEPKIIPIKQNELTQENVNKEENGVLIKNISDNEFKLKIDNSRNNEQNNLQKYITSPQKEKEDLSNNINNEFNNHKYVYINNSSKEKNNNQNNNENEKNDFIIYKNKKYKIEKIENINNLINNNYVDNRIDKNKNDFNFNSKDNNINNKIFLNTFNERIEKIREGLNSLNVIDILSEQAGFQSYKNEELKDEEFYDKAKKLNQEFYNNLDDRLNEIENILNNLEKK